MIDLIERIGPIVGVAAFLGLAVLAFLIFQQGREVRRLRDWAGRAPERAREAADASVAAAEARGEAAAEGGPGRLRRLGDSVARPFRPLWEGIDRNSPVDPVYLVAILAAALIATGVLTSGFGFVGGDEGRGDRGRTGQGGGQGQQQRDRPIEVAVLNATQTEDPATGVEIAAVAGLAEQVGEQVVRPIDGFRRGAEANATSGLDQTVIMFEPQAREDAERLAAEVEPQLGETPSEPMIQEVRELVEGARLAIVLGQDDADF